LRNSDDERRARLRGDVRSRFNARIGAATSAASVAPRITHAASSTDGGTATAPTVGFERQAHEVLLLGKRGDARRAVRPSSSAATWR
jgi:hypothetical protein